MKIFLQLTVILLITAIPLDGKDIIYKSKNGENKYTEVNNKRIIVFDSISGNDLITLKAGLSNDDLITFKKVNIPKSVVPFEGCKNHEGLYMSVVKNNKVELNNSKIKYSSPYFKVPGGDTIGISPFVYLRLKNKSDEHLIFKTAKQFNLDLYGKYKYDSLLYIVGCNNNTSLNILALCSLVNEMEGIDYCEPDFMIPLRNTCTSDPNYTYEQWALNPSLSYYNLDICSIHETTKGDEDIKIAIIDGGVELNHPDIQNVILTYDAMAGTSPQEIYSSHGTAVAGIIGAQTNNGIGIAGIAPGCKIISISLKPNTADYELGQIEVADAFNYAVSHGASVINCSWEYGQAFGANDWRQLTTLENAIKNALNNGRNSKGTVVVFGSGNGYNGFFNDPTNPYDSVWYGFNPYGVLYPANFDTNIVVVGSIDYCGYRAGYKYLGSGEACHQTSAPDLNINLCKPWPDNCEYQEPPASCYGNELDVVAPGSHIYTTDLVGSAGSNSSGSPDGDYTWFYGTSSAAPHVSGIVALMLSINPCLTQNEVRQMIKESAIKINNGAYSYSVKKGLLWNNEVGNGFINGPDLVNWAMYEHGGYLDGDLFIPKTYTGGCNGELIMTDVKVKANVVIDAASVEIRGSFEIQPGNSFVIE